jgi:hypothetical protein
MTIELRKIMRSAFLVGYTRGMGKESLKGKQEVKASAEFEKFWMAMTKK